MLGQLEALLKHACWVPGYTMVMSYKYIDVIYFQCTYNLKAYFNNIFVPFIFVWKKKSSWGVLQTHSIHPDRAVIFSILYKEGKQVLVY